MFKYFVAVIISLVFCNCFASVFPTVTPELGESEYAIVFAREHLDELLSVCAEDRCHFNSIEKDWLRTLRDLAQNPPVISFKTKYDLGDRRFLRLLIENQLWINKELLWTDSVGEPIAQVAKAVTFWIDVLLENKDIPRLLLAILEYEIESYLVPLPPPPPPELPSHLAL